MIEIFADADAAASDTLTQLVQLVVLCIPLFILPVLIKNSSSIMGRINSAADRSMKGLNLDKGMGYLQGGARSRAKAYGKFGAIEGSKWAGGAVSNSNLAQSLGGRPGVGRVGNGARRARDGWRTVRAADRAVLEATEARKASKQAELQSAARQIAGSTPIGAFGGTAYAGVLQKAYKEQVDNARASVDARFAPGDVNGLRDALIAAVQAGNHTEARALTDRMSTTEGGRGVDGIREAINHQAVQTSNAESRQNLANAIKANGKDVAGKGTDVVAWGGQGATTFAPGGTPMQLKDSEVVTLTPAAITAAVAAGSITPAQSARIMATPATNKDLNDDQRAAL